MSDTTTIDTVLRFVVRTGKVVIGSKRTLKLIKHGKIRYVVITANVPEEIKQDIEYYAKLSDIRIVEFPGTNKDLGATVGKPFSIAVMGIVDLGQVPSEVIDRFVKTG